MAYSIGLDFGTGSARALVVRCSDGAEIGTDVAEYPSGDQGVLLDPNDHNLARQNPGDYVHCLAHCVQAAVRDAADNDAKFDVEQVIGIGVAATGSSPIPVDADNSPIALNPKWKDDFNAQCWLWKDHTASEEAIRITSLAREHRPQYVAKCGNTYSSEWFWSKIWQCLNVAPEVFEAAHSWVEKADWIPSVLAGVERPEDVKVGVCAAGHKAMYADDWGGLPDREFLAMLDPRLAVLRDRLYEKAFDASEVAGHLCGEWAERLGLRQGIPIAIGEIDVHYGAIGAGVDEGVLVKVIGTSTCDCGVVSSAGKIQDIPGICGIVKGSILPGYYGIEAGQSAVGDIFAWWVEKICDGDAKTHQRLTEEASNLKPGQSGLLALDWNNGNRTVLVDQRLTGALIGQTLHTSKAEIYRALIEATAFGARTILERLEEYGVRVDRVVCAGGIAEKNPLLMQIYADVTGREMQVSRSAQSCALGAAIAGAVMAGPERGGHPDYKTAQRAMTGVRPVSYKPSSEANTTYDALYEQYALLHDAFGGVQTVDLGGVMKTLLEIKERASKV